MKRLSIQLNRDYKSFNNGFTFTMEGDLIILSGVNGSGKSQLVDIISQRESHGNKNAIPATINLDDNRITRDDILCRTFKENIGVTDLTRAGTETIKQHKDKAWDAYHHYSLNNENEHLWDYGQSCEAAKKILIDEFGQEKFDSGRITQIELQDELPDSFVWRSDDIFTNIVGELFFNHAVAVLHAEAEAGKIGAQFDLSSLPTSPWEQMNSLFSDLDLDYRFKDNYFIEGLQINEQPTLYHLKIDGSVDENEPRKLADLSDGEKSIIALSFASLSGVKQEDKKVLLLDEFDANFNPSLTELFYKILDKYFISQGILVVIATHSPTTISLAPDNASFYEVFKKSSVLASRILPVQKYDYAELKIANETFYTKISDQTSRIAELERQKEEFEVKISEFKAQVKPVIFVEGEIDEIYLKRALEIFGRSQSYPAEIKWIGCKDTNGNVSFTGRDSMEKAEGFFRANMPAQRTVLFYDVDCKKQTMTQGNLTIYCPQEITNAKYKTGIEHLLVVLDDFDISNTAFREIKKSGDKETAFPKKSAIKDHVLGLPEELQKQWLTKINSILEELGKGFN